MFCGRRHLQGLFESLPDGRINLRLRCPDCLQYGRHEWIVSGGMFELAGFKSFRPAFNRMQTSALHYWTPAHERQRCPWCGAPVQVRLLRPGERFLHAQPWAGLKWTKYCSSCDSDASNYIGAMIWLHPLAQQFMAQHPRWLNEPEQLVEYAGQPAFRVHLTDSTSAASLTFLLHSETLHVHTVLQEH